MKKINCELCGEGTHVIKFHLRDYHGEGSASPISYDDYVDKFPKAPLVSQMAADRLKEAKSSNSVSELASVPDSEKGSMSRMFNLGNIKAAKNASGSDIMIDICQDKGFEELIPDRDPNYVFDVENLKTMLMAISANMNVYLYGNAGVGKSTMFEQICSATKRRLLRVQHTIDTESSHIVGQMAVVREGEGDNIIAVTKWVPGPLQLALKHGWLYLADEYDRGHPSVSSTYQAILEGKPLYTKEADEEHRLIKPHPNFRFGATGNTNGSGDESGLHQATVVQDAATIERFAVVIRQGYMTPKQEVAIVQGQSKVLKEDAVKIVDFANKIRELHPSSVSLSLGPRVAINIGKIGLMRGDFKKGVEVAFTNRLQESEKEAVNSAAQRIFG